MLLGAYGRGAAARVAAGVEHLATNAGEELEVIDRGDLVLAVRRREGAAVAEQGGRLCVLDGEITAPRPRATAGGFARSRSPAELLEDWQRLGEDMVNGMRGRFVFVLWDGPRRSGLVVRDLTGVRPLVQAQSAGCLVFASEIKQLLGALPQTPPPDPVALAFWLSNDFCWADRTFYEGVAPLRGGRLLALENGRASERTWWRPRYAPPRDIALPEAQEAVRDAITRSIDSRLPPTEEVGVLLSGGLDSSAVAALGHRVPGLGQRLTGYSAVFPDHPQTDELERVDEVSRAVGIPSVRMAVHDGSPLAGVLRFIGSWGVPPPSANCFFWPELLARARADGVRLLLGGEGGDELFALSPQLLADRLRRGRPLATLELARRLPGGDRQSTAVLARYCLRETAISTLPTAWLRRARRPSSAWNDEPAWLEPRVAGLHAAAVNPFAWKALDGPRWWAYAAHTLTEGREIFGVSEAIHRLYEGSGLRVHQPLLDPDLVELLLGLPPELAFDPRHDRPVLRAAVSGLIPEAVRTSMTKSDFGPVLFAGIVDRDLPLVRELLLAPQARIREFVRSQDTVVHMLDDPPERHPGGRARWAIDVWRLLAAECWLRTGEDSGELAALTERAGGTSTSFHLESP